MLLAVARRNFIAKGLSLSAQSGPVSLAICCLLLSTQRAWAESRNPRPVVSKPTETTRADKNVQDTSGSATANISLKKIVSFAPSNTELIYALGAEKNLEATCTFCDYPESAKQLPKAGTFVSANLERLTRLKPDTVVVVSGQEALASTLAHNRFDVKTLPNTKLSDISTNLLTLGTLTGKTTKSRELASHFDASLRGLHKILATTSKHPKVFYCVWPEPLLTVGKSSFLHDVITECGGINIAASATAAYPHFSAEKLMLTNPDVIILPFEAQGKISLKRAPWCTLRAVKEGHAYFLPAPEKNGLIRPTLRIINGLSWLCDKLYPEQTQQFQTWNANSAKLLGL